MGSDSHQLADKYAKVPFSAAFETYCNYVAFLVFGSIHEFFINLLGRGVNQDEKEGYAPLVDDFEGLFSRLVYTRVKDCWGRPIGSAPGATVRVLQREENVHMDWRKDLKLTGNEIDCINLSSYNYLGYGEMSGGVFEETFDALHRYGIATSGSCVEGKNELQTQLENKIAKFLNKEAAMIVGMGFATNSEMITGIVGKGCLIVSDALNHASIIVGARRSGAKIRVFSHDDPVALEEILREAIATGQPETGEPWLKILVIVEGVYSMEGEICNLPEIIRVKKKYGAYLYLDEAHSIGAMGETGRGISEYYGVDTKDIDVMMGTFTKSFASIGGYIASSQALIDLLACTAPGSLHSSPMSSPCAAHIIKVLNQLIGEDGTDVGEKKILALKENTRYFRRRLKEAGMQVYGADDSPVIPIMIYNVGKLGSFSRMCLRRGLAIVVVGFPATPLILSRARICVSAAHTREQLDEALTVIREVAILNDTIYDKPRKLPDEATGAFSMASPTSVLGHSPLGEEQLCNKLKNEHQACNGHCLLDTRNVGFL